MLTYPETPQSIGTKFREIPNAYIFDKLDGSNLRFQYSSKKGFHLFGTRERLFDTSDKLFGLAIPIFFDKYVPDLTKILSSKNVKRATVFCELWNNQSLGGWKRVTEHPELTLFDVAIDDELLSPKDYLKLFGELDIARYLGQYNFTRGFVESIYEHKLEGITLEGVIAKSKTRKEYLRSKAKTRTWLELIKKNYSKDEAEKLINS